ncbi:MAG: DNA alkylation repair protein [Ruoffia tabacinasalis]|uniref:DNA alkylation repair protein n=1 Tax=Ruoffia sp. FAM 24228 TaxID=3259517 RepID=UPI0038865DFC
MNQNKVIQTSEKAETIFRQIDDNTKLGDLRKIVKEIKVDHELAMELWSSGKFLPRLLSILIMDKKLLSEEVLDELVDDMQIHTYDESNNLMDWLLANQLTKNKKLTTLMESWEDSPYALQRRTYWYHQGRLRWTGKTPPNNTSDLVTAIEAKISQEQPEVQWAMNFTAGWIGVYEEQYRKRCVIIGEDTGLYKDEKVSKGCTPNYLPEFIMIESNKRDL